MSTPPETSDPILYGLWVVGFVAVAFITYLGNKNTQKKVEEVKEDTEQTVEQTVNAHQDTEYPNLRDELTAVRGMLEEHLEAYDRKVARIAALEDLAEEYWRMQ